VKHGKFVGKKILLFQSEREAESASIVQEQEVRAEMTKRKIKFATQEEKCFRNLGARSI